MRNKKNALREVPISFEDADVDLQAESETPPQLELAADGADHQANSKASDHEDEAFDPPLQPEPVSDLQGQVDALSAERASLYDQLLRRQAEFENYRKRVERERSLLYQRGRDDVLLQFLPVVDNFERALSSLESSEGDAEALRHGVDLIHRQFKDALSKFGLEPVESVGQTFDPHLHEAVTTEATDKHKENTVIEEFQRGYKIGDKLLRPAKVKVASSPEK
jgi:molecular chaperone GrpE